MAASSTQGVNHLTPLPSHLLFNIFQSLPLVDLAKVMRVCRRFQALLKDLPLLHQRLEWSNAFIGTFHLLQGTIEVAPQIQFSTTRIVQLWLLAQRHFHHFNFQDFYSLEKREDSCVVRIFRPVSSHEGEIPDQLLSFSPDMPHHTPLNINLMLSEGKLVKFTGTPEIEANQASAEKELHAWAKFLRESGISFNRARSVEED